MPHPAMISFVTLLYASLHGRTELDLIRGQPGPPEEPARKPVTATFEIRHDRFMDTGAFGRPRLRRDVRPLM